MRVLIRTLNKSSEHSVGYVDQILDVNRLTIGRGTDQDLLLSDNRVALKHAVILAQNDQFQIQSKAVTGIVVNDHLCRVSILKVGDRISIGDNLLTVLDAKEHSVDLAFSLEVVRINDAITLTEDHFKTSLNHTRLFSKRFVSWTLLISLLMVGIIIPVSVMLVPENKDAIRESLLPDDSLWLTGELHQVHSFMGKKCESCHQKAFEPVVNQACMSCHKEVKSHVDVHHQLPELTEQRCASCHREHEDTQSLIRQDQESCVSCHRDIQAKSGSLDPELVKIENVGIFGKAHPDFKLSLLKPRLNEEELVWSIERHLIQGSKNNQPEVRQTVINETNHLKFSHQQHLVKEGIQNESGAIEVLECGTCHQPQLDGGIMQPISMVQHCSSCHRMEFDPTNPKRQIPHGDPELLLLTLKEYYSRQFLDGLTDQTNQAKQVRQVRRPGVSPTATKTEIRELALNWAEEQTELVAKDLIEKRACITCHQVDVKPDAELAERWFIRPIKISHQWLPKANFSHRKHETSKCTACHEAETSESTEDILIPNINNCTQCHSGQTHENKLFSSCVMCHGFHLVDQKVKL